MHHLPHFLLSHHLPCNDQPFLLFLIRHLKYYFRGTCVAQSIKRPTLSFSWSHGFVGSSPTSGSVLAAWGLLGILSPLSLCPSPTHAVSVSLKINWKKKYCFRTYQIKLLSSENAIKQTSSIVIFFNFSVGFVINDNILLETVMAIPVKKVILI